MVRYVVVNDSVLPEAEACVPALDRGFLLADGVFETLRTVGGRPFRLDAHLARLRRSASVLALPIQRTDAALASSIKQLLAANGLSDAVVRVTVSRGVPHARGLLPPAEPRPTTVIQASEWHPLAPEKLNLGFHTGISSIRRNERSPTSLIKSCNYLDNVLARVEAQRAGHDEAILLNTANAIACCSSANIFLIERDRLVTPALECGVLAGITRLTVIELAGDLGVPCEEAAIAPDVLWTASEAFLTNSVLGIVPITAVDQRPIGAGKTGPLTNTLMRMYGELLAS